eukprot:TRINITY_DN6263_c0_g1_i7.p1 TRINITY_DN6263_c0_g1~~TRINITY_DN6263_c0_g1_i7.p1  ORF type:complete len:599 (-),score=73.95 TRINITY_DN6263_c0_g1_i7:32-1828(-)
MEHKVQVHREKEYKLPPIPGSFDLSRDELPSNCSFPFHFSRSNSRHTMCGISPCFFQSGHVKGCNVNNSEAANLWYLLLKHFNVDLTSLMDPPVFHEPETPLARQTIWDRYVPAHQQLSAVLQTLRSSHFLTINYVQFGVFNETRARWFRALIEAHNRKVEAGDTEYLIEVLDLTESMDETSLSAMPIVAEALAISKSVRRLLLASNILPSAALGALAPVFATNTTIEEIDLSIALQENVEGMEQVAAAVGRNPDSALRTLILFHVVGGDALMDPIARILAHSPSLEYVDLSLKPANEIFHGTIPKPVYVGLKDNVPSAAGVLHVLQHGVASAPHLKVLALNELSVGDVNGLSQLWQVLNNHPTLEVVLAAGSADTETELVATLCALHHNNRLKTVSLGPLFRGWFFQSPTGPQFGVKAVKALCSLLRTNHTLRTLNLAAYKPTPDPIQAQAERAMIVQAAADNQSLTALYLPPLPDLPPMPVEPQPNPPKRGKGRKRQHVPPPPHPAQAERDELEARLTAIRWRNLVRHEYTKLVPLAHMTDPRLHLPTDILKLISAFSAEIHLAYYVPSDLTCGFMWNNSPGRAFPEDFSGMVPQF